MKKLAGVVLLAGFFTVGCGEILDLDRSGQCEVFSRSDTTTLADTINVVYDCDEQG